MFNNFLGGLSSGNGSCGGGDALPTAENRVTFDEVEATADFENQLGPPPAGFITQTQGDAPTAGYIVFSPAPVIGHSNEIRYSYEFISYIPYYVNSYKARLAKGQTLE
jgi:hypothetical protein